MNAALESRGLKNGDRLIFQIGSRTITVVDAQGETVRRASGDNKVEATFIQDPKDFFPFTGTLGKFFGLTPKLEESPSDNLIAVSMVGVIN